MVHRGSRIFSARKRYERVCGDDEGCHNLSRSVDMDTLAGNLPAGARGDITGLIACDEKYDAVF